MQSKSNREIYYMEHLTEWMIHIIICVVMADH